MSQGGSCTKCSLGGGYRISKEGALYAVSNLEECVTKLGIANVNSLKKRLIIHRRQGLSKVVRVAHHPDGSIPPIFEQEWKTYIKSVPEFKVPREVVPSGFTEAVFTHDGVWDVVEDIFTRFESTTPVQPVVAP